VLGSFRFFSEMLDVEEILIALLLGSISFLVFTYIRRR
jgi:hypothetical protein